MKARVFGPERGVGPVRHLVGSAVGWGGLTEVEALHLGTDPRLAIFEDRIGVPADGPVGACRSICLCNAPAGVVFDDVQPTDIHRPPGRKT